MTRILTILTILTPLTIMGQIIKIPFKEKYPGTNTVKEKGWFKHDNCVGTWKYYSKDRALIKTINFDTGEKKYYTDYRDPYDDIFKKMQAKANSFLLTYFDTEFIDRHIKWNINGSYFYGPGVAENWFNYTNVRPNRFLFRYDIVFDQKRTYEEVIQFELDVFGNLIHKTDRDVKGITNCKNDTMSCKFNVSYRSAIDTAQAHGLKKNGKKYIYYLDWRKTTPKHEILGVYEIVVARFNEKEKNGNRTTYKYDAVIIDPWTGKFKEMTELKSYTIVHTHSAFSSGLMR